MSELEIKTAFQRAIKFAASKCERCPYDSRLECRRSENLKNLDCESAVELYFRNNNGANNKKF